MRIKEGVSIVGMSPEMAIACLVVDRCYLEIAAECMLTSGTDGKHMAGSLHYVGRAGDFRTKHLSPNQITQLKKIIPERLGRQFDVVWKEKPPHVHVEFDPK